MTSLIGVEEVAALTGFAEVTVQQRRIKGFPNPLTGVRRLKWRLGDIRAWIRSRTEQRPAGRSSKQRDALA
jgi:predicted DNA-binding transcriptional regulator AlpA